jgi:hypothetical protein
MRTHRRPSLRTAFERALLERDRREIAAVERLLKVLRIESQRHRVMAHARHRRGR